MSFTGQDARSLVQMADRIDEGYSIEVRPSFRLRVMRCRMEYPGEHPDSQGDLRATTSDEDDELTGRPILELSKGEDEEPDEGTSGEPTAEDDVIIVDLDDDRRCSG